MFPQPVPNFSFRETIFFVMTSYTFIGYGSYCVTVPGRVFFIVMLLLAFVAIPDQTSQLISLVSSKSKY